MTGNASNAAALLGRFLLALMFVLAGYSKIGGFDGIAAYIGSKGLPLPQLLAVGTIVLEIAAGLALMVGYKARWAAAALAAFTLLASVIFHAFWAAPPAQQRVEYLMFIKNVAVIGGLLTVLALGAGGWSLDARRRS
jgi:putative oxidoreductase